MLTISKFKTLIRQPNFSILKSLSKNFSRNVQNTKSDNSSKNTTEEANNVVKQDGLFDPKNKEFSQLRIKLIAAFSAPHKNIKLRHNYEEIYQSMIETISYYSKTKDAQSYNLINSTLLVFLEKHISNFTLEQMIRLSCEMGKNNLGTVVLYNSFADSIFKKLQNEKQNITNKSEEENLKVTKMLYYYLSIMSEVSMMEVGPLNFIIEYFTTHSSTLLNDSATDVQPDNLKALYDFTYLLSISIASILEKRKNFQQIENYVDTVSPVLSEIGARGLTKILKFLDKTIHIDKNYSQNSNNKIRLYKSLYYLKLEGINIPANLEKFMLEFSSYLKLSMEANITPSITEHKFENVLTKLKIPFEREKKLAYSSVDFYVSPDIIIEVNGPSHYVFNSSYPIAKDMMKKRVYELEHYDFIVIQHDQVGSKKIQEFLAERFKHILDGFEENFNKQLEEEKNILNLYQMEKARRNERLDERIKNSKYLI